jgi:hypothetical protein
MITDVLVDPLRYVLGICFMWGAGCVMGGGAVWWYMTSIHDESAT